MSAIGTYQENTVTTQNKGTLVVMLYDGAIKYLKQAVRAIQIGDAETKGIFIAKALDIIFELNSVLDMEAGGQITKNLRSLYNFISRQLSQANISHDEKVIQQVISILEELNQGWRSIAS
ncbi:MAG: flagellar export chaperone FliS [Gammaproteobacteria bacterium]|nr:flagellar export chaperone FliS [Gammaproteobacteria bacterium]